MANIVKWTSPASAVTVINGAAVTPTLKALASAARKLGIEYDNSIDLYQFAAFELFVKGASAFSSGGYVSLYIVPAFDDTNYADGGDSLTPSSNLFMDVFQLQSVSTQQRLVLPNIPIPPFKFKPLVINNGGQAFTNVDDENLLKMRPYNDQIVVS